MRLRFGQAGLLLVLAACSKDGPQANGFRCSTTGTCPGGFACIEDRCWKGGVRPDGQAPPEGADAASPTGSKDGGGGTPAADGPPAAAPDTHASGDLGTLPTDAPTVLPDGPLALPDTGPAPDLGLARTNGSPCSRREDCGSGICAPDGTCCESDCTSPCEACNVAGNLGRCTRVPSGQPRGKPACGGSGACAGNCNGTSASCAFPTSACGTASCSGSTLTKAGTCDGSGSCTPGGTEDCGSYACRANTSSCATTCVTASDCAADHFCGNGKCISKVVAVAAGDAHTCAVLKNGKVMCWGDNSAGQLGIGSTGGSPRTQPVEVTNIQNAKAVSLAFQYSCALTADQRVYCWGRNDVGQLGDGTGLDQPKPVPVAVEAGGDLSGVSVFSTGSDQACAGTSGVMCWGRNVPGAPLVATRRARAVGSLGVPTSTAGGSGFSLVAIAPDRLCGWGVNGDHQTSATMEGVIETPSCMFVSEILELGAGFGHACARLRTGNVRCWGRNHNGQLGFDQSGAFDPPGPMDLALNATKLALGADHSCALASDGSILCWGDNGYWQLGDEVGPPSVFERRAAGKVAGLTAAVALGSGSQASHTCAILADGSLDCWGQNFKGQLGSGQSGPGPGRRAPVKW